MSEPVPPADGSTVMLASSGRDSERPVALTVSGRAVMLAVVLALVLNV